VARIPKETVDQIIQTADILEVVGDYVPLKRKGQNYWACCPFHNEKSPSFSVTPGKGFYKCFGCGKSGNAVGFVMEMDGVSYPEALRQLAKKYGIAIVEAEERTPEDQLAQNERDSQFIVSDWAKNHYHGLLLNTEEGMSIGHGYLRERGLNLTTIQTFELGYSLDQWDDLLKAAEKAGYQLKYLEKTGLVVRREDDAGQDTGRRYDRFRGRVMFPIHNASGRVVGFGARTLKRDDKMAKYLNSPESDIYHKSEVLYGLFQARQAIRNQDLCYLAEGYLDVISLHQGGIKNVVASSGTSLTEGQIRLIRRYTNHVTVLYDGDAAGIKASLRGIDLLLEGGLDVRVVLFPDGDDPDSYIRKVGDQRFAEYLEQNSQEFISFKIGLLRADLAARGTTLSPVARAEMSRDILRSIAAVQDELQRQGFVQQTAEMLRLDERTLITELNKILEARRKAATRAAQAAAEREAAERQAAASGLPTNSTDSTDQGQVVNAAGELTAARPPAPHPAADYDYDDTAGPPELGDVDELAPVTDVLALCEREVLRLLVLYAGYELAEGLRVGPYLLAQLEGTPLQTPFYAALWQVCRQQIEAGEFAQVRQLSQSDQAEVRELVIGFATDPYELSPNWRIKDIYVPVETDLLRPACDNAVLRLNKCHVQRERQQCLALLNDPSLDENEKLNVFLRHHELTKLDSELARLLGTVVARGA